MTNYRFFLEESQEGKNESYLTEAPGDKFTIDPQQMYRDMNNTNGSTPIKLGKIIGDKQRTKDAHDRKESLKAQMKPIIDKVNAVNDSEKLEILFNELVPKSGKANTVAGEIVRATMRIIYRYYNDGDYFMFGYGMETCNGSAEYIYAETNLSLITAIYNKVKNLIQEWGFEGKEIESSYEEFITQLQIQVVSYLLENLELFTQENKIDSRNYASHTFKEVLMDECDVTLPYDLQRLIDDGYVDEGELENEFDSWEYDGGYFNSVEISSGSLWFYELDSAMYDSIMSHRVYRWLEQYAQELLEEYIPEEDDEE